MGHTLTTRSGVGFRVLAYDGSSPNFTGFHARCPNASKSLEALRDHLQWRRVETPWYSVYWNWALALQRARWYRDHRGATDVVILMLDLEQLGPAIDAYAFAQNDGFMNPNIFSGEQLYHGSIPGNAVLVRLPANSRDVVKNICTGQMAAPEDIWVESELLYRKRLTLHDEWRYVQALREWLSDQMYGRYMKADRIKVERILESMFKVMWD